MNKPNFTRREMLKGIGAGLAAGFAGPLAVFAGQDAQSPGRRQGFRLGIVDWELTKPGDPGAFAKAARLGFDGVQVDLGNVEAFRDPERQKRHIALAKESKVEIASLALGVLSQAPFATTRKSQALVDTAVDIAKAMNQKLILLAFFGKNDFSQKANQLDALVGRLKENAPKAEKAGVTLGVEGETSVERYRELIDRVGSPAVKVYFDCVHAHVSGRDIFQEITLLGDRICEFHAKDYGNILFGQGNLDWREVRRGMDSIGYRGWIQFEQWGEVNGEKPLGFDETHRRNLAYLRKIFPRTA